MASKGFISNRLFDALACGCVVVTDRVEGIGEVFGNSVLVYHNEDEFRELIASIDKNYENYKKAALDFSSQIRQNHSFDQRAGVIAETIKNLLEIQGLQVKK
jgi:spore maturation protein CgeB